MAFARRLSLLVVHNPAGAIHALVKLVPEAAHRGLIHAEHLRHPGIIAILLSREDDLAFFLHSIILPGQ